MSGGTVGYANISSGGSFGGAPTVAAPEPTGHFAITLQRLRAVNNDAENVMVRLRTLSDRLLGAEPETMGKGTGEAKPHALVDEIAREIARTESLIEASRSLLRRLEDGL